MMTEHGGVADQPPSILASCWTTAGSAGPSIGNDLSEYALTERIAAAAEAGFDGFGLLIDDLQVAEHTVGWGAIRDALRQSGMHYVEIEMLNGWFDSGEVLATSIHDRDYLLQAASYFHPRHVKVGGDISGRAFDLQHVADRFRELCAAYEPLGCRVAFEIMPFGNIPTIAAGRELIERAGHPNGGLMIDLWHIARSTSSFDEIADLPDGYLLAVELDDADEEVVGTLHRDTLHHRRLPGEGVQDVPAFVDAVRANGFDGPWGIEIISDEHRAKPLHEQAQSAFETAMRFLS